MKIYKFLLTFIFYFLFLTNSNAFKAGQGELYMSDRAIQIFIEYIRLKGGKKPYIFVIDHGGNEVNYYFCPQGTCQGGEGAAIQECETWSKKYANGDKCSLFARYRTIKWTNGINKGKGKLSKISSKLSDEEIIDRLDELGFIGKSSSSNQAKSNNQQITQKTNEGYELSGKRSIALNWQNYNDLIAGTIEFDEKNYSGKINLPLPNKDGNCTGSYSLQKNGKGTWQISCTNNMGAAGTLKWIKDGGVTGQGRDYEDNKVKFTVSSQG